MDCNSKLTTVPPARPAPARPAPARPAPARPAPPWPAPAWPAPARPASPRHQIFSEFSGLMKRSELTIFAQTKLSESYSRELKYF